MTNNKGWTQEKKQIIRRAQGIYADTTNYMRLELRIGQENKNCQIRKKLHWPVLETIRSI